MSAIASAIEACNAEKGKALSVFLTAGFPSVKNFVDLAVSVFDAGADIIEVGIPFSDPLADGTIIQQSSQSALENGVTLPHIFEFTAAVKAKCNKPIILMGYANPILHYGISRFFSDAKNAGADGLIVPDVPLEEYDGFFGEGAKNLEIVMLSTPASGAERIKQIDNMSRGFVYCVSVLGTTGARAGFSEETILSLQRTRELITKNKMLVGFGISSKQNIQQVAPHCDGVIVGSAVIKSLMQESSSQSFSNTLPLVGELKDACRNR